MNLVQSVKNCFHFTATDAAGNISSCEQLISYIAPVPTTVSKRSAGNTMLQSTFGSFSLPVTPVADKSLQVKAYPNPYSGTVMFSFVSPVTGTGSLELYDVMGRRLAVVYQRVIKAGLTNNISYKVPSVQRSTMIYKLSIDDLSANGKLIPGN